MISDKIIQFLTGLNYTDKFPEGISIMNPFRDNPKIIPVISQFYHKFYNDSNSRHLILGINPGRFGAGVTGIPFTDSKRLADKCELSIDGLNTFETSSVFIYEMIDAFGGVEKFYVFHKCGMSTWIHCYRTEREECKLQLLRQQKTD
jgi:hypothetical protein